MLIDTAEVRLPMKLGQVARLQRARNTRLTALRGIAWITVDGDPRDIVLEPGESFVVDSNEGVLIYPLRNGDTLELAAEAG
jgi:hypothetical protein